MRRWEELRDEMPHIGPAPTGAHAIALMRLVVQAQDIPLQCAVLESWGGIDEVDKRVLSTEMARSGVLGQSYERSPVAEGGPAFLVYYSPAFVRTCAASSPRDALRILAELYRQARSMWPVSAADAGVTVTIRIDQLKDREGRSVESGHIWGDGWLLFKRNEIEVCTASPPNSHTILSHHPLTPSHTLSHSLSPCLTLHPTHALL